MLCAIRIVSTRRLSSAGEIWEAKAQSEALNHTKKPFSSWVLEWVGVFGAALLMACLKLLRVHMLSERLYNSITVASFSNGPCFFNLKTDHQKTMKLFNKLSEMIKIRNFWKWSKKKKEIKRSMLSILNSFCLLIWKKKVWGTFKPSNKVSVTFDPVIKSHFQNTF